MGISKNRGPKRVPPKTGTPILGNPHIMIRGDPFVGSLLSKGTWKNKKGERVYHCASKFLGWRL